VARRLREGVLAVARRLGREDTARALRDALRGQQQRQNQRDDQALTVLMASVLCKDSNCIDVGAHRGIILEQMVRLAPEGRHIAFEPYPGHGPELASRFPTVDVRSTALFNETGRRPFRARADDPALSGLANPDEEQPEVDIARLDDALPEGYRPALIKIDVEGAEYQVLEGATETLRRHRPVVAFEHSLNCRYYGTEPGGVHGLLESAGLRIFDTDGRGPYGQAEFTREVLGLSRWFFFARPW
jgi:FkbM family methyltransferase